VLPPGEYDGRREYHSYPVKSEIFLGLRLFDRPIRVLDFISERVRYRASVVCNVRAPYSAG